MNVRQPAGKVRPVLISHGGLLVLAAVAVVGFAALFPLAYRRADQAVEESPSALSVIYLRLAVQERPHDAALKIQLADAELALGHLQEARTALAPLTSRDGQAGRDARLRLVYVERAGWAAHPTTSVHSRNVALGYYRKALRNLRPSEYPPEQIEQLGALAVEADDLELRGSWLRELAMRKGPDQAQRIAAAERAFLEAGRPLDAARLRAELADRDGHVSDAVTAIRHARAAARPDESWAIFERMRRRFGARSALLEAGVQLASERGLPAEALVLAEQLLALEPTRTDRHAQVLQLATWSGKPKRALVEQLWLLEHGADLEVWKSAQVNARALSELGTLRKLYEQRAASAPLGREELVQLIAVYEALGQPEEAQNLLGRALSAEFGGDYPLWNLRLSLERAAGRLDRAVETLAAMDTRFPRELARSELRADLLLRLDRPEEAVKVLADATPHDDYVRLSRLAQLAWSTSNADVARAAYRSATLLPKATEADYFQLYSLDVLEGDLTSALATALRGLARFPSVPMFELSMSAALNAADTERLSLLLSMSEQEGHPFQVDPRYVALRVSYRQALAASAIKLYELDEAKHLLAKAEADLSRGLPRATGKTQAQLLALKASQRSQMLSLALLRDDRATLRKIYPEVEKTLSVRQRVHVLHQLRRDDEALRVALDALEGGTLDPDEREALRAEAKTLAWQRPRQLSAEMELSDMNGLRLWQRRAGVEYTEGKLVWSGGLQYNDLEGSDSALALGSSTELIPWLGLKKLWDRHDATMQVGVDLRLGGSARPYAALGSHLRFDGAEVALGAQVDGMADDTAALRAVGVRDQLTASVEVPFTQRLFGTVGAAGAVYSTRDRELLGAGATVDGSLGFRPFDANAPVQGNMRIAVRAAPRWTIDEQPASLRAITGDLRGLLVPDSTTWVGVGASVSRGMLSLAPVWGRDLSFLLDGSVGWLLTQQSLGYFARAGLGYSPMGRDQLTLSGRAGNVLGTSGPSRTVWSAQIDYGLSLWR